jgi:hypothetical protein
MPYRRLALAAALVLLGSTTAFRLSAAQAPPGQPPAGQAPAGQAPAAQPAAAGAQDDANWKPEKLTNLTVLPKTTTPDQVMAIMREWNDALNVDCIFCHKGKLKAPLSTFDFADDSKEHKETTRSMLRMTNDINTKYPEGMGDDSTLEMPKVTCATCHRRARHPETDLPPKK